MRREGLLAAGQQLVETQNEYLSPSFGSDNISASAGPNTKRGTSPRAQSVSLGIARR